MPSATFSTMQPRRRSWRRGWFLVALLVGVAPLHAAETFPVSELAIATAKGRFAFTVEMAVTEPARAQGLQERTSLAPGAGMLFDFERTQPVHMWMKNTPISLDMIFIGADGRVVNIGERTVPFSLATVASARPVRAVLEVRAGTAERLGIRAGDEVLHPIFKNR